MDREQIKANQKALREKYLAEPESATTPLDGYGDFSDEGVTCTVQTWAGPVRAGLHRATGGDGSDACSGDMLMQALAGCAGVTFRSVANAMRLDLGVVEVTAQSTFDARGTLGIDRTVPVGVGPITVTVTIDADLDDQARTRLAQSTERYCVVGQSLATPPAFVIVTRGS
jgi:uncharacterized OsmC-like protein